MNSIHPTPPRPSRFPLATLLTLAALTTITTLTTATSPAHAADLVRLFNGRDLDGWSSWLVDSHHNDPRHVFSVTNGLLRISGDGLGYLATDREFADYHLTVEWRWGTRNTHWGGRIGKARDSGVFLHATGPHGNSHDGNGAFMAALECNIFQGATGDLLLIRGTNHDGSLIAPRALADVAPHPDPEGWHTWLAGGRPHSLERWGRLNWASKSPAWRDVTDFRGPSDAELPPGQWNILECIARADTLRFILNGTLVNDVRQIHPRRGRILLQCEGSEIFFRRVDLRPLAPDSP